MRNFPAIILLSVMMISCYEDPLNSESNVVRKARYIQDIDDGDLDLSVIKPLALGNEWTYHQYWFDDEGKEFESEYTLEITDTLNYRGYTWYLWLEGFEKLEKIWQRNSEEGLLIYFDPLPEVIALEAKYPAKAGDTWKYDAYNRAVVKVDTLIKVPAGEFPCIYYLRAYKYSDSTEFMNKTFYSPGIGMIKTENLTKEKDDREYKISNVQELKTFNIQINE